jgi:hypothetical protein
VRPWELSHTVWGVYVWGVALCTFGRVVDTTEGRTALWLTWLSSALCEHMGLCTKRGMYVWGVALCTFGRVVDTTEGRTALWLTWLLSGLGEHMGFHSRGCFTKQWAALHVVYGLSRGERCTVTDLAAVSTS